MSFKIIYSLIYNTKQSKKWNVIKFFEIMNCLTQAWISTIGEIAYDCQDITTHL